MTTPSNDTVMVGAPLTLADVMRVANHGAPVALSYDARARIVHSRDYVDRLVAEGRTVYGVTTGFGKLANVRIAPEDVQQLQRNLVRSHAMGVGEPLSQEIVRGMLLLRAQSLSLGFSGIRVEVIELLIGMLNHGIHPIIPSQGSVGASGDLAPLAHMALALIGEGKVEFGDAMLPAAGALEEVGLKPVTLEAKEGLALINGTQAMTAIGALTIADALELATAADIAATMSLEALKGSRAPFDPRVTAVRGHPGAAESAANVLKISAESPIGTLTSDKN